MSDLIVQKMSLVDVDKVFELESKYIGGCDKETILKTISSNSLKYYVLMKDNEIIGFFECMIISPDAELYDIVIDEKYRGFGYSKILMDYFINLATMNKVETIFLEVNSINNNAISLYEKYGFEKYSIRKNYYGDNDAILMKKLIKS